MILFSLNATYAHQPLGTLTLKSALEVHGFAATSLECTINERDDEVLYRLCTAAADDRVVGFSCYIWNIEKMRHFASCLKKLRPDCIIAFGGPEVSFYGGDDFFAAFPFADCLIRGEGEGAVVELCGLWQSGRAVQRLVIDGAPRENIREAGQFGRIYENAADYCTVYYESSRGCPYSCSYCVSGDIVSGEGSGAKKRVRAIGAGDTVRELCALADKYYEREKCSMNIIKLVDRSFNYDIKRANTIWAALIEYAERRKSGTKPLLPFQFEIYPDTFDEDSFRILAAAPKDFFHFEIGVQSLNPATLGAVGRRADNADLILKRIERLKSPGNIPLHLDLIAGLPFETYASFAAGFNRLYPLGDFVQLGFLKFLRGTAIRRDAMSCDAMRCENAPPYSCLYEDAPPYAVLATDTMPYSDLMRLRRIEIVHSKYTAQTYAAALAYCLQFFSPFALFETLAAHYAEMGYFSKNISQKTAFLAFHTALLPHLGAARGGEFARILEECFFRHENKRIRI